MAIREATDRVRKSTTEMKAAMRGKCKTPGCDSHLTLWKGPGEKEYCDPCQRNFAAFGISYSFQSIQSATTINM